MTTAAPTRCRVHGVLDCGFCAAELRAAAHAAELAEITSESPADESPETLTGVVLLDVEEGRAIAEKRCAEQELSVEQLRQLVRAELSMAGKLRKRGLFEMFDQILDGASSCER